MLGMLKQAPARRGDALFFIRRGFAARGIKSIEEDGGEQSQQNGKSDKGEARQDDIQVVQSMPVQVKMPVIRIHAAAKRKVAVVIGEIALTAFAHVRLQQAQCRVGSKAGLVSAVVISMKSGRNMMKAKEVNDVAEAAL